MLIILHEEHVEEIHTEEEARLPPPDVVVNKEEDECDEGDAVEGAVPEQRPPGEVEHRLAEQRAHPDHEEDVEHGGAHDGADTHVRERDEHADNWGEQLGRRPAGSHEGGARHVLADAELLDDDVQRGDEELVADDGEGYEHVDDAEHVQRHGARRQLVGAEEVWREEGVWLWLGGVGGGRGVGGGLQQVPEQHTGGVAPGLEPLQPLLALVAAVGRGLGLVTLHVLGESQVEHPGCFLESDESHNITHHYSYI